MTTPDQLSDGALAILTFALYHQLSSGDVVSSVIAEDGAGHRADPAGIAELEQRELATREGDRIVFTAAGALMISQLLDRVRGHW